MNTTTGTKVQQQRKFFTILPLLAVPFVFLIFFDLRGGVQQEDKKIAAGMGFNIELPAAIINLKEDKMDKLAFYQQADQDSARRKERVQMDPYRRKDNPTAISAAQKPGIDTQANVLLRRLDIFKKQIAVNASAKDAAPARSMPAERIMPLVRSPQLRRVADTMVVDPELDRLNEMLDKIARLQGTGQAPAARPKETAGTGTQADNEASPGIPATVDNNQQLMNGATLALRLTSAISYNGITIQKGQLVYGMASMNNDRMQVVIHSIRSGQSILNTSWMVYDMDGVQGIRIPDGLGRQVARQSADQGIGSLNLATYDPSIGGQLAGAGIQAAKSFLGRKVRTVKVIVPSGYQVLLRDSRTGNAGGTVRLLPDSGMIRRDSSETCLDRIMPPMADSLEAYLHISTSEEKIKLTLRGIYERDGLVWLYLTLGSKSPLAYVPDHIRCTVRQARHWRRMAMQEISLQAAYDSLPPAVKKGSEAVIMLGLKPFGLPEDRRLVVQLGERDSGRELELSIPRKAYLAMK